MGKQHSQIERNKALQRYEDGESVNNICKSLGVSRSTFYRWKNEVKKVPTKESDSQGLPDMDFRKLLGCG